MIPRCWHCGKPAVYREKDRALGILVSVCCGRPACWAEERAERRKRTLRKRPEVLTIDSYATPDRRECGAGAVEVLDLPPQRSQQIAGGGDLEAGAGIGQLRDGGASRSRGSAPASPSQQALALVAPHITALQRRVLEAIRAEPCTDEEGIGRTGMAANTWRPRRLELVKAGLVQPTAEERRTASGCRATVWSAA